MKNFLRVFGSIFFIVVILASLFSYAMFQGGFVSWFLFSAFLPILLYQLFILFYPLHRWKITRILSQSTLQAGGHTDVTLKIKRSIPFPLAFLVFEEVFPSSLELIEDGLSKYKNLSDPAKSYRERKFKKVIFPHFKREFTITYKLMNIPRGEHSFSSVQIKVGDIFGFVKREHTFSVESILVAAPSERSLYFLEQTEHQGHGVVSEQIVHAQRSNIASSVREYVSGDKLTWIDWKQTAKQNVIMTKEFEQERSGEYLVVLDQTFSDGMNELAFEAAVEVTLSLVKELEKQSSELDLLLIGKKVIPISFRDHSIRRVHAEKYLTRARVEKGALFSVQLKRELLRLGNQHTIIIVTTQISEELVEVVQQAKRRRNKVNIIFIYSEKAMMEREKTKIKKLQLEGVTTHLLTEQELLSDPLEVNIQ